MVVVGCFVTLLLLVSMSPPLHPYLPSPLKSKSNLTGRLASLVKTPVSLGFTQPPVQTLSRSNNHPIKQTFRLSPVVALTATVSRPNKQPTTGGDYDVVIPNNISAGEYKIRVAVFENDDVYDCSGTFDVVSDMFEETDDSVDDMDSMESGVDDDDMSLSFSFSYDV